MRVAFVFPGQGAQEVGMGGAFAASSPEARAVFDAADRALVGDPVALSSMCFQGPAESLTLTANTQPAILATSLACLAALRARLPSLTPVMLAGHSLGEYTALVAAGALDLDTAVKLLRLRGTAMQEAVPPGVGAMAAVIALDDDAVAALCAEVAAETGRVVQAANFNCPGQVVVAGHADAVDRVRERVAARGAKTLPLHVSAPFHCALMEPAAARLDAALAALTPSPLRVPVVANVDGAPYGDAARVRELLVRQVAGTVRWSSCVRAMLDAGVDTFVEVGPGKVLSGLIKRIQRGVRVLSVSDPTSLEATAAALIEGGL
jgi:[acyl-carrier-protein] S-malonyltransferase